MKKYEEECKKRGVAPHKLMKQRVFLPSGEKWDVSVELRLNTAGLQPFAKFQRKKDGQVVASYVTQKKIREDCSEKDAEVLVSAYENLKAAITQKYQKEIDGSKETQVRMWSDEDDAEEEDAEERKQEEKAPHVKKENAGFLHFLLAV